MKLFFIAFCGCVTFVASGTSFRQTELSFKCANVPVRFPDAPEPAYILNGVAVEQTVLKEVAPEHIASIEVACADYIYATFGIKAQRTGLILFTSPAPHSVLNTVMDSIARLQATHVARWSRFAGTVDELGWRDDSGLVAVELKLVEDGAAWTATGTHRYWKGRPVTVSGTKND
jgi:hypothetical protein